MRRCKRLVGSTLLAFALTFVYGWAVDDAVAQSPLPPAILISRQLASAEQLRVGDMVTISSRPDGSSPRQFRIAGIYEPVADPMRLTAKRLEARLHLSDLVLMTADAADRSSLEWVTAINLSLTDPGDADNFSRDASAAIPIPELTAWPAHGDDSTAAVFVVLDRFHFAIAVVTVIASTLFLLALMVMLVEERRESVGILRLIGLRKSRILAQVFAEGLLIAVAGALFGILVAVVVQGAVNAFFQWRYDTTLIFVRITPGIAARCVILAVPLGMLASLISSWTLLRGNVMAFSRR